MTETRWAVDGPDGARMGLGGRKVFSNDECAPVMCNLVCSSKERHVHIDYCRTDGNKPCNTSEVRHINDRIVPEPNKPKDAITHGLYWKRMGSSRTIIILIDYSKLTYRIHCQGSKVTLLQT